MDYETLWLRVEAMVLDLMEQHGETRNSIGPKLGLGRNYLRRYLLTAEQSKMSKKVDPAFDLAFQIAEHLGVNAASLLEPFASDAPEALLQLLPCPDDGLDEEMLLALSSLDERVIQTPVATDSAQWPDRRATRSDLGAVYAELEALEQQRHFDAISVASTCREHVVVSALGRQTDQLPVAESVRLIGLAGIWGSVQRCRSRLAEAREAVRYSLMLARRSGDQSLYANQLQRSAYVFKDLDALMIAKKVLREALERFHADGNDQGVACTLVDCAVMEFHKREIRYAESLYRVGLEKLPKDQPSAHRLAAIQGIATCRDLRGDVRGALEQLVAAAAEQGPGNPRDAAALLYNAANIERRLQLFAEAEEKYWTALDYFVDGGDADAVLRVCLDLSACLVLSGRVAALEKVRKAAQTFLPRLRDRRTLQYQYELLLRELTRGQPTVTELERIRRSMRGMR